MENDKDTNRKFCYQIYHRFLNSNRYSLMGFTRTHPTCLNCRLNNLLLNEQREVFKSSSLLRFFRLKLFDFFQTLATKNLPSEGCFTFAISAAFDLSSYTAFFRYISVSSLMDLCKRQVQTMFPPALIRQLDLPQFLLNSLLRPLVAPWHRLASSRS